MSSIKVSFEKTNNDLLGQKFCYVLLDQLPSIEYIFTSMMQGWKTIKHMSFDSMEELDQYIIDNHPNDYIVNNIADVKIEKSSTKSQRNNYVYYVKDKLNGKIYIGNHSIDKTESKQSYYGSSSTMKTLKIPKERLKVVPLHNFINRSLSSSYERALIELAREVLGNDALYNKTLCSGGGNYGEATNAKISQAQTINWQNNYDENYKKLFNPVSNAKRVASKRKYNEENPLEFQEHMRKINNNPTKILNTSTSNTGSKRTTEAKKNISKGIRNSEKRKNSFAKRKGLKYVTDTKNRYISRQVDPSTYILKDGEEWGIKIPDEAKIAGSKASKYKSKPVTNLDTGDVYHVILELYDLLPNEMKGKNKKLAKHIRQQKQENN